MSRREQVGVDGHGQAPELPDPCRAIVYTPQEGDVVVLEVDWATVDQADQLKHEAEAAFGRDVKIIVLAGAHFAGVVRDG